MFMIIRRRRMFSVAAVVAVLCCGCSDDGIGGAFCEQKIANIERDDIRRYKTVTIGNQTWTARNLDIQTGNSWCYADKQSNCDKYGRLYDWFTAMNICPVGWHLPTSKDWDVLMVAVGGSSVAGKKLKAYHGWYNNDNVTDDFQFSALPGGDRLPYGDFNNAVGNGFWWTATECSGGNAYYRYMYYNRDLVLEDYIDKSFGFSARCVQD